MSFSFESMAYIGPALEVGRFSSLRAKLLRMAVEAAEAAMTLHFPARLRAAQTAVK